MKYKELIYFYFLNLVFRFVQVRLLRTNGELISNISNYHQKDYRRYFSAHLQFLSKLCDLSIQTVNSSINEFLSSLYITTELISEMDFNKKLSSSIEQVKSNLSNTITNLFFLIRSLNLGNALVSMYGMNFEYIFPLEMGLDPYLCTQALVYDNNCSCDSFSNCTFYSIQFI